MKKKRIWTLALLILALSFSLPPRTVPAGAAVPLEETAAPRKFIALTFDDGPYRPTTLPLLGGLAERGVKATFFLIGNQLPGNEALVRRMDEEGHQIGIHTYDHVPLTGLNKKDFSAQVDRTRTALHAILGHNDFLLRPPFGAVDAGIRARAGGPIILWSVDPEDWKDQNADAVVSAILREAKSGDIILLHDIFPSSVEAALRVVDELRRQGFFFVTVDGLFEAQGIELKAGAVYHNARP